jgi:AcrR family transcriptional regulator
VESTFQRARRPEQKQARRAAILAAARRRADRDGVRTVSLGDIAADIGIHKSALLRYFETREEIYLELTAAAWGEWEAGLAVALGAVRTGDAAAVAAVLARSFADRTLFCDLLDHTPLTFERHVSVEAVRRYKRVSLAAVSRGGAAVAAALPALNDGQGREVISILARLAGQTWQIANPPAELTVLYRSSPEFASACVELAPSLERAAGLVLAGLAAEAVGET